MSSDKITIEKTKNGTFKLQGGGKPPTTVPAATVPQALKSRTK